MNVFDRKKYARLRERASYIPNNDALFLGRFVEKSVMERLRDVKRDFENVLLIGARVTPEWITALIKEKNVQSLSVLDIVEKAPNWCTDAPENCTITYFYGDEETLPFEAEHFDLIISAATLHSINDVPGAMIQAKLALKPDGLFLAVIPGGKSLQELRYALAEAEEKSYGGVSPRVSPFADVQQIAGLMQRAGFALPVVDFESHTVEYRRFKTLIHDLRAMGEGLCLTQRNKAYRSKAFFEQAEDIYKNRFLNQDGHLVASYEFIYALGWAPHASQQQPMRRGTAQKSLTEVL